MNSKQFASATSGFVANFGKAAHQAIDLYRTGGERLADKVAGRWDTAFKEASPKLTPETRKNAKNAQHVFGRYYAKSLALSADGAVIVVDTFVGAAIAGVERATAFGQQVAAKA